MYCKNFLHNFSISKVKFTQSFFIRSCSPLFEQYKKNYISTYCIFKKNMCFYTLPNPLHFVLPSHCCAFVFLFFPGFFYSLLRTKITSPPVWNTKLKSTHIPPKLYGVHTIWVNQKITCRMKTLKTLPKTMTKALNVLNET